MTIIRGARSRAALTNVRDSLTSTPLRASAEYEYIPGILGIAGYSNFVKEMFDHIAGRPALAPESWQEMLSPSPVPCAPSRSLLSSVFEKSRRFSPRIDWMPYPVRLLDVPMRTRIGHCHKKQALCLI
jgi:hypothetical protein